MISNEPLDRRYLEAAASALDEVAERFRAEPASFLCERDLQAVLFALLFDRLSDAVVTWNQAAVGLSGVAEGRPLRVNPVKTEYPADERFDVAVLAPEKMYPRQKAWSQPVRVGIELKLWQADQSGGDFHADRKKLELYLDKAAKEQRPFAGVCIAFCHRADEPRLDGWGASARRFVRSGELSIRDNEVSMVVVAPPG